MTADEISHGTYAGYQAHRRRGIPPCDPCRTALRDYMRVLRERGTSRDKERVMNRVRSRALWKLAHRYPAAFQALVDEELKAEHRREAS